MLIILLVVSLIRSNFSLDLESRYYRRSLSSLTADSSLMCKGILSSAPGLSTITEVLDIYRELNLRLKISGDTLLPYAMEKVSGIIASNNRTYLENDSLFLDSLTKVNGVSGKSYKEVYAGIRNGRRIFVKNIGPEKYLVTILTSILNSKLLEHLGLGPRTDFIEIDGDYYLIMDEVQGINVKELLSSDWRTAKTKKKINEMLEQNYSSVTNAVGAFAKVMMGESGFELELDRIQTLLLETGFIYTPDFQFMVSLDIEAKKLKVSVIDVGGFRWMDPEIIAPRNLSIEKDILALKAALSDLAQKHHP